MGFFGGKKQSYLGVDLGTGGIKLVELQNEKGRARLFTYGFTERLPDAQPPNLVDAPKETAELLRKIVQKTKTSTKATVAGLPVASVFSAVITVPKTTNEKDLRDAVQRQARKLVPIPLEEMVLDYKPVTPPNTKDKVASKSGSAQFEALAKEGDKKEETKTVQMLVTGAAKTLVQKYVTVFKLAGLELVSLETESFALIRSLIGKDRAVSMIVDIGAVRTNIIIVENGVSFVTRSLDMGGATLTKAMSATLSMDMKTAEQTKCDIKGISSMYPGEGLPKIFENAVAPLLTELQYSRNLYLGRDDGEGQHGKNIEKIILTGGTAALPALAPFFAKAMGIKTYVGDPWARVVYSDELRPVLEEIGPRFAVPLGLAMRDIE